MHTKKVYELNGKTFSTLDEFASHFSDVVLIDVEYEWSGNLDAFNDILRGGFGTPDVGFVIRWLNSDLSRERLGYKETTRYLESKLANCHPSAKKQVSLELETAMTGKGQTLFDMLVEIIRDHGRGGRQSEDGVELELM